MEMAKFTLKCMVWVGLVITGLIPAALAQDETGSAWKGRYVIRELKPVVDPEMLETLQSFVCLEVDIRSSELSPTGRGGVARSRALIRSTRPGSTVLQVTGVDPAYRVYQAYERFGVMTRILSWAGSEHIFSGTISFEGHTFESDPAFPLHFKYVEDIGYVHLCGRGTVVTPEGLKHSLGESKGIDDFIREIKAEDQLTREGASEALGWLTRTQAEKDKAVPALIGALRDEAMEVRRNAASSLGKIGDLRGREGLVMALHDRDEWVREVAADALKRIVPETDNSSS
jgi:hypothetical protein